MRAAESKPSEERSADDAVSIWLRAENLPSRQSPLTRQRIVSEAVRLLDLSGLAGLTMRRLAEGLSVTATALYWHVRTRDDVLDLALDHVVGNVPLLEPTHDWQSDVRHLVRSWRAVMLRHPWAPSLIGRPMLGPNVLARTEYLQSALSRGGLEDRRLTLITRLLANYVIGSALTESTFRQSADPRIRADARRHVTANPAAYPVLNASGHLDAARWDDDDLFEQGLDTILAAIPQPES